MLYLLVGFPLCHDQEDIFVVLTECKLSNQKRHGTALLRTTAWYASNA